MCDDARRVGGSAAVDDLMAGIFLSQVPSGLTVGAAIYVVPLCCSPLLTDRIGTMA